jgi:hydrogenase maturation factor
MHDPTEGGLANALHEVAAAAGVGLVVEEERIRVLPECGMLCELFGLDPLGLIASGSLLVTVDPSDSRNVIHSIRNAGIYIEQIGKILPKEKGVRIRSRGGAKALPRFARDEIAKVLEGS